MGGLYDLLEKNRFENDPRYVYEGLFEDAPSNIATSSLIQALQPGFEFRTDDFIENQFRKGRYDLSGNVPVDRDRRRDFQDYFQNKPLRPTDGVARFENFNPRVGNITPLNFNKFINTVSPMGVNTGIMTQAPNLSVDVNDLRSRIDAAKNREILNRQGLLSLDDAGIDMAPTIDEFSDKAKPGLNINFAKQLGSTALGLLTGNPIVGLLARGIGALGDRFRLPGRVGGVDLRGDTGFDTFRRSTSLADFLQRRRDKRAREEAARRGAEKQRIQKLREFNQGAAQYFGGGDDRPGGFGQGAGSFRESEPTATEGSF